MTPRQKALSEFQNWYDALPRPKGTVLPYKGSICVGLVILERLKNSFDLDIIAHLTQGGGQVRGVSTRAVERILAAFDETRPFAGEAGRSNRGSPAIAKTLLNAIRSAGLDVLDENARQSVLRELQEFLVEKVREFHNQERLKPIYDPTQSTRQFIRDLLALANQRGKSGPVAQYLVGAKLRLRFPAEIDVRNESYSAADDPSGQPGDFVVGDTSFHVTVAPTLGHFEKCQRNLQDGHRVFLLVPDSILSNARQTAELTADGRIAVESIESFISQNIEELSTFSCNRLRDGLRRLLETYNSRVNAVEIDKSMMVEMPKNLAQQGGGA